MKATPTARLLLTIKHRSWSTHEALAELLDNAFGEHRGNAQHVCIAWSPRSRVLIILDNGRGMNDVIDLFTMGKGVEHATGDIGFYGVGGSEALLWLSDRTDVWTLRAGRVANGTANWGHCIATNQYPDIDRRWRPATVSTCPPELLQAGHGTMIKLEIPKGLRIDPAKICEKLSRLYAVGLRNSRAITWITFDPDAGETQLAPWSPGPFEQPITITVTVGGGLSAQVTAGRVDGLSIANSKLAVNYVYRQIKDTMAGFGRPVQGACGYIDLSPEWLPLLTTNKDGIREDCRDQEEALMARIAEGLKPLVDQLVQAKRSKLFTNLALNLKQKFELGFLAQQTPAPDIWEEEDPETETDPHEPPARRRRHRRTIHASRIHFEEAHADFMQDRLSVARIVGNEATVYVNVDHPIVVTALEAEPINQLLLEQLIIEGLAGELMARNALVTYGLLSQGQFVNLTENCNGVWDMYLSVVRMLRDGLVSSPASKPS